MHCRIENCDLNFRKQQAEATFFLKVAFKDPDFLKRVDPKNKDTLRLDCDDNDLPHTIEQLRSGDICHGVFFKNPGSEDFPFNPHRVFKDQPADAVMTQKWIRFKHQVVSAQLVFRTSVFVPVDISKFPFDQHVVPIRFAVRGKKVHKGGPDEAWEGWQLEQQFPDWAKKGGMDYGEDIHTVTEANQIDSEFVREDPVVVFTDDKASKPIVCLRQYRNPQAFAFRTSLPVYLLVMLALVSLFTDAGEIEVRFGAVLSSALSITTYQSAVREELPKVDYLTRAEHYFFGVYLFNLVVCLKVALVTVLINDDSVFEEVAVSETASLWSSIFAPLTRGRTREMIDQVSTWTLIGAWTLAHLLILAVCSKWFNEKHNAFLKPWPKLIRQVIDPDEDSEQRQKTKERHSQLCDKNGEPIKHPEHLKNGALALV